MDAAQTYLRKRRNVLPVAYFPGRKGTRQRKMIAPATDQHVAIQIEPLDDVIQIDTENEATQMTSAAQIPSHEEELQYDLDQARRTVAKREEKLQRCQQTIQNLHSYLGTVDLTVEELDVYDDILMSNETTQNGTNIVESMHESTSSDSSVDGAGVNKENEEPLLRNQQQKTPKNSGTDMMFSFQHEFVEDVHT